MDRKVNAGPSRNWQKVLEYVDGNISIAKFEGWPHPRTGGIRYSFTLSNKFVITAASLVPFVRTADGIDFLLVQVDEKNQQVWQTLGGKVEKTDMHWRHTAIREFSEESGFVLSSKTIFELFDDRHSPVLYYGGAKHMYWFLEVTEAEKEMWGALDKTQLPQTDEIIHGKKWINVNTTEEKINYVKTVLKYASQTL